MSLFTLFTYFVVFVAGGVIFSLGPSALDWLKRRIGSK